MIDLLTNTVNLFLHNPFIFRFWIGCNLLLIVILTVAAYDDVKYRYINPKYFWIYWVVVIIPYIYLSYNMILLGYLVIVIANINVIIYTYYMGLRKIIGGSDARSIIAICLLWPCGFPCLFVVILAVIIKKIWFKFDSKMRDDSIIRGIPAIFFLDLGFAIMVTMVCFVLYLLI